MLVPLFLLYQAIAIVSAVVTPFVKLPLMVNFFLGIIVIILFGWVMIHVFKKRLKKHLKRVIKNKKSNSWLTLIASAILEFDTLSDKAHKAFRNPILYKVDDGIYKLGYITNNDISFINNANAKKTAQIKEENEISEGIDAVWVYAPYPVNFFGEMVLVEKRKIKKLNKDQVQNLPLFILSAGILQK